MKVGGDKEKQLRDDYDRRHGKPEFRIWLPISREWWKWTFKKLREKKFKKILGGDKKRG